MLDRLWNVGCRSLSTRLCILSAKTVEIGQMKVRRKTLAVLLIGFLAGLAAGGCATNNGVTGEDAASNAIRYGGWKH